MKVRLKMMIQDPRFAPVGNKRRIEGYDVTTEEFSDGPSTKRVKMLDLDGITGTIAAGARFIPPKPGRILGRFDLPKNDDIDIESRTFNQVSVIATVLKTIAMYEDPDVLGRPVTWNFDDPQLTVIPRLSEEENAYYSRERKRLEFHYFKSHQNPGEIVYTSLSRDIVAHETGHSILDGIAPHLLDPETRTYQSLALHEAIGDITGLLIAIDSSGLRRDVLAKTKGSIQNSNNFSALAEQFGMAQGKGALRNLRNHKTMNDVNQYIPHNLSEVLTGALYSVLIKMHNKRWDEYEDEYVRETGESLTARKRYSFSGKALWVSSEQLKRMALRALDYLPPGDVSFADYARAVIAADQASHPDDLEERSWLKQEFIDRLIVADEKALTVAPPVSDPLDVDLEDLLNDHDTAEAFVDTHRELLRIPQGSDFTVGPRLKVTKKYYHRAEDREPLVTECLLKVWWPNPKNNSRKVGTTLAIDWATKRPRILLTNDHGDRPQEEEAQLAVFRSLHDSEISIACCS